jgi:carbon monoxide dehydrogenase subunit G
VPTIERTFTVHPSPATVIAYLQDFGHAEQWDPGTEQCTRNDAGPIAVGASWHNKSKIMGVSTELSYTLEELSDERIVFVGRNDTAISTDTITVRPGQTGSEITYHAQLELQGAAKLATPVVKAVFEKVANDTERQLTGVLNAL